jgi:hypothetical protein
VLDPDEQAQATIRLVFDLFERLRTIGKVLRYLVEHDLGLHRADGDVKVDWGTEGSNPREGPPPRAISQIMFCKMDTAASSMTIGRRSARGLGQRHEAELVDFAKEAGICPRPP